MDFIKYHSLGNDIILVDKFLSNENGERFSSQSIRSLCDRHYGVGADGVIVLEKNSLNEPVMYVFNADGSQAETCFNGLRCVADHVYRTYDFPEQFTIHTSTRQALCTIKHDSSSGERMIETEIDPAHFLGQRDIETSHGVFRGHVVHVGNPHFVIFQQPPSTWLENYGHEIESHVLFPQKTNVEFVVPAPHKHDVPAYNVLVYERGCGITLSCGSGAAAVASILVECNKIPKEQPFFIHMPGGSFSAHVTERGSILLKAPVTRVFRGHFFLF